jgi:two-component system sensor histidine kinase ChvG
MNWRYFLVSKLTLRVLIVNMIAPMILVIGLFYLDRYQNELIKSEFESLKVRAQIISAALSEYATPHDNAASPTLSLPLAGQMLIRLTPSAQGRTQIFNEGGELILDSRFLLENSRTVLIENIAPPEQGLSIMIFHYLYHLIFRDNFNSPSSVTHPQIDRESDGMEPEVMSALFGETQMKLVTDSHHLSLRVALPIQRYKKILGVIVLTTSGDVIEQSLFKIRLTIFQVFLIALVITITLSLYLSNSIVRPIKRLARLADRIRNGMSRYDVYPDLLKRHDEIGELSHSLSDMTKALWMRMDAIESFAADVAHEIKNPMTSLKSAVDAILILPDKSQKDKLLSIIQEDITRLDRLISDISESSRVDAELSRVAYEPISCQKMIRAFYDVTQLHLNHKNISIDLNCPIDDSLMVNGNERRLAQVLQNIIDNAISFTPKKGTLHLSARREKSKIIMTVEDEGPGISEGSHEKIFERFYSERPSYEKFGTHSGLGLSISQQIIKAHRGDIRAENRLLPEGTIKGACFTVTLPAL